MKLLELTRRLPKELDYDSISYNDGGDSFKISWCNTLQSGDYYYYELDLYLDTNDDIIDYAIKETYHCDGDSYSDGVSKKAILTALGIVKAIEYN